MPTLIHGGDIYSAQSTVEGRIYDFSANINPLGIPESVKKAAAFSLEQCVHYPDPLCRELTASIAEREGVPSSYICCGNGAADLIYRIIYALRPSKGMVLAPTFAEYELALRAAKADVVYCALSEDSDFCLDTSILSQIKQEKPNILFLCNPNNPTGQTIERSLIFSILKCCKECGTLVVIDECFGDFLDDFEEYTLVPYLKEWDHLLILKAFTKMYAIPGLRIGYSLCSNEEINEKVLDAGQAWSVSIPAQSAGTAAAKDREWTVKTRSYLQKQRKTLSDGLRKARFKVWEPKANYIFFKIPNDVSIDLKEEFKKQGILIRSCANYPTLDERYFRIAVKTEQENEWFLTVLNKIISERKE